MRPSRLTTRLALVISSAMTLAMAGQPALASSPPRLAAHAVTGTAGCGGGQVVVNGGFEAGTAPWTASPGVITNAPGQPAHTGFYKAWLGGYGSTHTDILSQTLTLPAGCSTYTLSFYLHIDTAETTRSIAYDRLTVQLDNSTLAMYSNLDAGAGYRLQTFDVKAFAGRTVVLKFTAIEDAALQTSFVIDDVTLRMT